MSYQRHPIANVLRSVPERVEDQTAHTSLIVIFEGKVIAGWNRYLAAEVLKISLPEHTLVAGEIEAIRVALSQRDLSCLSRYSRAGLAAKLYRAAHSGKEKKNATLADIATLLGVSETSSKQMVVVDRSGMYELIWAARASLLTIEEAYSVAMRVDEDWPLLLRNLLRQKGCVQIVAPDQVQDPPELGGSFLITGDAGLLH